VYEWLVELDLETALQQFQDVLVAALELAFLRVLLAPEGVALVVEVALDASRKALAASREELAALEL